MPIFTSKTKSGMRSVNFMHAEGLPSYQAGDAINATINSEAGMLNIKSRIIKRPEINLPLGKILDVQRIRESEIIEKNKSVIGRAAVGALFGPTSAIIGGLSGLGTKSKSVDRDYIVIKYSSSSGQSSIVLEIVGASIGWKNFLSELQANTSAPTPDSITL